MLSNLFSNPLETIRTLLIMLPGVLLALSIHEAAHGYVANLCGDPTAKLMGRVTLNPLKHINPLGFACMFLIHFGWANPVPVNPNNFKHYRRDDVKVSLAGITANLILFLICAILVFSIFTAAVASTNEYDYSYSKAHSMGESIYRVNCNDETYLVTDGIALNSKEMFKFATGLFCSLGNGSNPITVENSVIEPVFGSIVAIIYEMLIYCMLINISLAVFNLIPIPPLDGYHVLNDIVLHKQDLFVKQKTARIAMNALLVLIVIGWVKPEWNILSIVITAVRSFLCNSFASLFRVIVQAIGII